MNQPSADNIVAAIRARGYFLYEADNRYDLNMFGVRSSDTASNAFNDWVGVVYLRDGRWVCYAFPATTDPGTYWRLNPMRVEGTAVLKPGQYAGAYQLGSHKGYDALVQARPVTVYRDDNRDDQIDTDESATQTGMFGINIHRAGPHIPARGVDRWSAGCQVVQDPRHFSFLLELARASSLEFGNTFTYTLLTEHDLSLLGT